MLCVATTLYAMYTVATYVQSLLTELSVMSMDKGEFIMLFELPIILSSNSS